VRLFLDTSVLLAACGSATGASRQLFALAEMNEWELITTSYVVKEVYDNLLDFPSAAADTWQLLQPTLELKKDVFTVDRPVVFGPAKDRPILFSALAWSSVLLTLDQNDFGGLMKSPFYGLRVLRPGTFLEQERAAGRLKQKPI
jgi:predicted nucleic acid-binding protein